jgi:hypothetical protein
MRVLGQMIKDAFIDGLNEPYSSYTRNFRPETLVKAYQCATDQHNANARKREKFNYTKSNSTPNYQLPKIFSRNTPPIQKIFTPQNQFRQPPPGLPPKPQPKPTPMDIDRSIRSRNIQYMNRNTGAIPKTPHGFPNSQNIFRQQPNRTALQNNSNPRYTVEELTNIDNVPHENTYFNDNEYCENTETYEDSLEYPHNLEENNLDSNPLESQSDYPQEINFHLDFKYLKID